jgi:hypothetical protein
MPKTTISARKHHINPDWQKHREERERRLDEREKCRDEVFEKLVTAATTVMEQLRMQQESQISLSDLPGISAYPKRNLSKAARDIFDRMGFGYILRVRPKKEAALVCRPTKENPNYSIKGNYIHDSLRLFFKNLCTGCIFLLHSVRESSTLKE